MWPVAMRSVVGFENHTFYIPPSHPPFPPSHPPSLTLSFSTRTYSADQDLRHYSAAKTVSGTISVGSKALIHACHNAENIFILKLSMYKCMRAWKNMFIAF